MTRHTTANFSDMGVDRSLFAASSHTGQRCGERPCLRSRWYEYGMLRTRSEKIKMKRRGCESHSAAGLRWIVC